MVSADDLHGYEAIPALHPDGAPELAQVALATLLLERGLIAAERDGLYFGDRRDLTYGTWDDAAVERAIRQRYLVAYAGAPATEDGVTGRGVDFLYDYVIDGQGFEGLAALCDADGDGRRLLDLLLEAAEPWLVAPTVASQASARFAISFACHGRRDLLELVLAACGRFVWPEIGQACSMLTATSGAHADPAVRAAVARSMIDELVATDADRPGFPLRTVLMVGLEADARDLLLEAVWTERGYATVQPGPVRGWPNEVPQPGVHSDVAETIVAAASPALLARLYRGADARMRDWMTWYLEPETVAELVGAGHDLGADGDAAALALLEAARARPGLASLEQVDELGARGPRHLVAAIGARVVALGDEALPDVRARFGVAWAAADAGAREALASVVAAWPALSSVEDDKPIWPDLLAVPIELVEGLGNVSGLAEWRRGQDIGFACHDLWQLAAAAVFARAADMGEVIGTFDRVADAATALQLAEPDLGGRDASEFLAWLALATATLHGHAALAAADEAR